MYERSEEKVGPTGGRERSQAEVARDAAFIGRMASVLSSAYCAALGLGGDPVKAAALVESAAVAARREYGEYRPGGDFEAWFLGYLVKAYRRLEGWSEVHVMEDESGSKRRGASDAVAADLSSLDTDHVIQALQGMAVPERLAMVIHAVGGYRGAQVVELLDVHPSSARVMLRRGRRLLKDALFDRAIANRLQISGA